MKIFSECFDYKTSNVYSILAAVCEYSANKYNPSSDFELYKIKAPDTTGHNRACVSNTVKLDKWVEIVEKTDDNVVLMDCDMLFTGDISHVFEKYKFDIALCQRTKNIQQRMPFNGGIVFVRNNRAALDFMKLWQKINLEMFNDVQFHNKWRPRYAGMNQSAFGYIFEKEKYNAKILFLPCKIYNCCREDWPRVDSNTKVIHVKSGLRKSIVNQSPTRETKRAYEIWYRIAEESGIDIAFHKMRPNKDKQITDKDKILVMRNSFNYNDYLKNQKKANREKDGIVWSKKEDLKFLCNAFLNRKLQPKTIGICHGAGNGNEIKWLRENLKQCKIIGTDIVKKDGQNIIEHDFNKQNKEWEKKFDFVYSNSFHHAYNLKETILLWTKQLNKNGFIIIAYNQLLKNKKNVKLYFNFTPADLINKIRDWTNGEYMVTKKIDTPINVKNKSDVKRVSFYIIERKVK